MTNLGFQALPAALFVCLRRVVPRVDRSLCFLLAAAFLLGQAAQARDWGDTESGEAIADRWCSACHMVSPEQALATPDVPSFMEIARNAEDDLSVIEGFLIDPHPPMPDLHLTREEIRDLIAYFATLR